MLVKKASFYVAQYPVLRTVQCALHFTSLTDLFTQTPSRLLLEASSHMLQYVGDRQGFFMQNKIIASHTCFGGHVDVNC